MTHTWTPYDPADLTVGALVLTAEDEPWAGRASTARTETVTGLGRLWVSTDQGTYFRGGRQTQLQPIAHPRRIRYTALAH